MNEATVAQTIMTILILVIFLWFLVWGIRSRQFHNVEEPKYRMLNDDDSGDTEDKAHNTQERQP